MIPKIIHYIWFGGKPFPPKIKQCINSWKEYLPDYEFMLWDETSFDVSVCPFTQQAYENKKWAFVSDYVRVWALNEYGGWYLDTDIEILKPLSPYEDNRLVLGTDHDGALTALMGSEKGHLFWSKVLNLYKTMAFINEDGTFNLTVNNTYLQELLSEYGYIFQNKYQELDEGIRVYPDEYFHVADVELGTLNITQNSVAIHWHTLLWTSKTSHFARFVRKKIFIPMFGERFLGFYSKLRKRLKRK